MLCLCVFQSPSVPFLSFLLKHAKKLSWVKEDKRSTANTGFILLYLGRPCSLIATWRKKVCDIISIFCFTFVSDNKKKKNKIKRSYTIPTFAMTTILLSCTLDTCEWIFVVDVDECSASISVCDVNANCKNTRGSYRCSCKAGFTGDGKKCTGENIME